MTAPPMIAFKKGDYGDVPLRSLITVCQRFSSTFRSASGVVMGAMPKFSTR